MKIVKCVLIAVSCVPFPFLCSAYGSYRVWKHVVRKGDVVVDATCGNGHDTLAMLKMVVDEAGSGCVYALDVQQEALESTSSLLDASVDPPEVLLLFCISLLSIDFNG